MSRDSGKKVSVHVHFRIARGGHSGTYDFWTLVVQQPLLSSIASAVIYEMTKALAMKTVTLLQKAVTRAKRVDMMIPFRTDSWVILRIFGDTPPGTVGRSIPNQSEVQNALDKATKLLRTKIYQEPQKPVAVTANLRVISGSVSLRVFADIGPREWPGFERQIAMARSEQPTVLGATIAKEEDTRATKRNVRAKKPIRKTKKGRKSKKR